MMATVEQLEDTKYFPPALRLGARHRSDTVVTTYVDGDSFFGAVADVLDELDSPLDRLYITSWRLNTSMRLRTAISEPTLGERLIGVSLKGSDVRTITAIPRFALGASWGPLTWNPASWDPELWREVAAYGNPLKETVRENLKSVMWLRDKFRQLKERYLIDWGGGFDSRHEKCTIAYNGTTGILHAFVGGMDYAADRFSEVGHAGASAANYWHDVGVHLQGGAAAEVLANFGTRWVETATLPLRRVWYQAAPMRLNRDAYPLPAPLQPPATPLPTNTPADSHTDAESESGAATHDSASRTPSATTSICPGRPCQRPA
jgi:hypothetical protein